MNYNQFQDEFGLPSSKPLFHNMLVGGVDEAGRGSALGPLVVAGVSIKRKDLPVLLRAGVRDSKLMSVKTRHQLFVHILDLAEHICVFIIDSNEVDQYVFANRLNKLEAKAMAGIIDNISASTVYVDACDVNPMRYKECIECELSFRPKIFSVHHADLSNTAVSAASIVAKVIRDEEIRKIREEYNEIGSGYPSDKRTVKFIADWVADNDSAPYFARKSWKPIRAVLEDHKLGTRKENISLTVSGIN